MTTSPNRSLPAELVARVRALVGAFVLPRGTHIQFARGKVFAFIGAKGGVGTTTLAVNVAIALGDHNKSVILVDLNHTAGAVAMQLGLTPGQSLLPYTERPVPPRLLTRSVTSSLLLHPSGIKVFPAPSRAELQSTSTFTKSTIQAILDELVAQAEYVVIDAGCCSLSGQPCRHSRGRPPGHRDRIRLPVIGTGETDA